MLADPTFHKVARADVKTLIVLHRAAWLPTKFRSAYTPFPALYI